ncbi:F-box/FBD/LRR-repeat protein At1g13570-like isoform X2 [Juglans regia]|uniref:F-box/FBD/LRR-repeat protein At1g13570-like isoform X2 n=1 Tax=Juglans regia TaxID=51240 RepID=A0A6P9EIK2_JUGRE|nr:F-box/FBD/LRR-repeat protein At1g13570-like isoform X2 [Juglans regia]
MVSYSSSEMKRNMPSPCDILSYLPDNVIENILIFLPLRDAVKTSVLSKKWRRNWGPILKFTLSLPGFKCCPEIKHLISFLARNDIQDLTLCFSSSDWSRGSPKLLETIFACLQLRHLHLSYCLFDPPPTFEGFDNLISIEFQDVPFEVDILKTFICKCPLLERLTLKGCFYIGNLDIDAPKLKFLYIHARWHATFLPSNAYRKALKNSETSVIIGFFRSLPVIESLNVGYQCWQFLAAGNVPDRLPANLKYLKTLELPALRFEFLREFSCALCLIRSSPNLQKLRLGVGYTKSDTADNVKTVDKFVESQDFSDISLNKLREVEMQINDFSKPEMEFVKLLLVKSPLLETMHIRQRDGDFYNGYRILKEVTRFRRASSTAEIIYFGPNEKP